MDTYPVVERPKTNLNELIIQKSTDAVVADRRVSYNGTPDTTACRVHSDLFAALVADLPADVFD